MGWALLAVNLTAGKLAEVPACTESEPIHPDGDADDAAIWVDSSSPENSVIISTDKQAGLHVYDVGGRRLQYVPLGGKTNNVDLRPDFPFATGRAPILAVTIKTDQTVAFLRFDQQTRSIAPQRIATIPGFAGPTASGVCLYQAKDGSMHVGVTDGDNGRFKQWRLEVASDGRVNPKPVRSFSLPPGPAEACVFDDEQRRLYIAQEKVGIWRLPAEVDEGGAPKLIDSVNDAFPADVEGLAIFRRGDGGGYLVASNQGNSTFRVYTRDRDNTFLGRFKVVGCEDKVDPVTETDGIEIASVSLGANWSEGMLVVHDGGNHVASRNLPNLKYVRWEAIARHLSLH
jgi:3-phytase